jgi:tryptophan-rich sensory protein
MSTAVNRRPRFDVKAFLFFEVFTLFFGFLGGILGGTRGFDTLKMTPLTPPAFVFPIVWFILYILMGYAAYLIWISNDIDRAPVLRLYILQLMVNSLWSLIFFRLEWRLFAFFWLLFLIILVSLTMTGFRFIYKPAYTLLIPYLLWLLFSGYLNLGAYLLNKP